MTSQATTGDSHRTRTRRRPSHDHTSDRSNCHRMPDRRARCRTGARRRASRRRAGTRDYRYGPPHVCGELGVAGDTIDSLDRAAPAMGGHAGWLHGVGRRRSDRARPERGDHRQARLGVAAASARADCDDSHSRPQGAAQSYAVWVVYPLLAAYALSALGGGYQTVRESFERRIYARRASWSTSADIGFTCYVLDRGLRPSSSNQALAKGGLLGMDLDRCRSGYQGVRLRSRGSRLERSGGCRAGRDRRGDGPPHPARSRARAGPVCAGWSFVGRAVRPDLRRPVSRTGCRNGLARRPTCRSVRGPSRLPSVLRWLSPHLGAVTVACSTWCRTAGLSRRLCQLACTCPRRAASQPRVGSPVPQPARRVRRTTDLACAGAFVSEPRRPTAGCRDRCAGRASGMAAVAGQVGDAVQE